MEDAIGDDFQCPSYEVSNDKFLPEISIRKVLILPEKGNQLVFLSKAVGINNLSLFLALDGRNS